MYLIVVASHGAACEMKYMDQASRLFLFIQLAARSAERSQAELARLSFSLTCN